LREKGSTNLFSLSEQKRRDVMKVRFLWVAVLVVALAACSRSGDREDKGSTGDPAMAGAKGTPTAETTPVPTAETTPGVSDADTGKNDPGVLSCLKLVKETKFDEALPVCLDALKRFPDNVEVQEAVEKAKAAAVGAAGAAVEGAVGTAQDAAAAGAEDLAEPALEESSKSLDAAVSQPLGGVGVK
jgi:hypothetical protein